MTHLHRCFNPFLKLLTLAIAIVGVLAINSCGETGVTPDDCSITITSFNVTPKTFSSNATLTGSVTFTDNVGMNDLTARSVTELYLSTDATYSSGDTQLDAFTDAPTHSGTSTTVVFDQIDIPNISAGSYYIVARIDSQPCGAGESSSPTTKSVAVTVN